MLKNKNLISTIILVFGISIGALYLLFQKFNVFANSNFFLAIVTLLVGSIAISLYVLQKIGKKRDAANIILMEIRHAEDIIDQIKKSEKIETSYLLLPTNNWSKYNYLFIGDLDRDELDLINDFYNQCELIDKSLIQMSISAQLEQKANHIHGEIVKIASNASNEYSNLEDALKNFNVKKDSFLNIIHSDGYAFRPADPQNKILKSLFNIQKIATSSAGNVLKEIAKLK